ncbi:unnamed protein product [Phyllotreta striolata]|uniref:Dynein regulatory complex protein 1 n=1 Tax=Phyllotreta striolata TaxID=444603 RepID=A0A9N9TVG5_PHYSR|nr:unnamed protein product [Phyllotreta striolata]
MSFALSMGLSLEPSDTSDDEPQKTEGPNLNSDDPEQRKLFRALRIQRRQGKWDAEEFVEVAESKTAYELQKEKSANVIGKHVVAAERDLLDVNIRNNVVEVARRQEETINANRRIDKLEADAAKAKSHFDSIVQKWDDLQVLGDPLQIHQSITALKKECDALMAHRDVTINMLKEEINKSEKAYVSFQAKNSDEIQYIFKKVENYIASMRTLFNVQFTIVQTTFTHATNAYMQEKNDNWNELNNEMRIELDNATTERINFMYNLNQALENNSKEFQEHYRLIKEELSTAANTCQQELENLKGAILLSFEQFEYNLQILETRFVENRFVRADRKRRITQLQQDISTLRKTIDTYKTTTEDRIHKYEDELKTLHQHILDIELKADNIATGNDKVFHEVWNMGMKNSKNLLRDISRIDKVLYEQQLALPWEWAEGVSLEMASLPSFKSAMNVLGIVKDKIRRTIGDLSHEPATPKINKSLLKRILVITSDKTGFLTEQKMKEITGAQSRQDTSLVRLENVFQSMNIRKEEDMTALFQFFLPYTVCLNCTKEPEMAEDNVSQILSQRYSFATSGGDFEMPFEYVHLMEAMYKTTHTRESIEDMVIDVVTSDVDIHECYQPSVELVDISKFDRDANVSQRKSSKIKRSQFAAFADKQSFHFDHTLVISSIYVIKALLDFLENCAGTSEYVPTNGERLRKKRLTVSRLLKDEDIKVFWENVRNWYGERSTYYQVWKGLSYGLTYYSDVLKKRKRLSEEVIELREENQRLKRKLELYKVGHQVLPPICGSIKQPLFVYQRSIRR